MDNNKKQQQNFSRTGNMKSTHSSTDCNRQKPSSDLQTTKNWPKNSRRRENPFTSARNNYSNNNSKQYTSTKARPNVDKRPRARGYANNGSDSYRNTNHDYTATGSGLASIESEPNGLTLGEVAEQYEHTDYIRGNKRQSLNHLLNFHCTPREVDYSDSFGYGGSNGSYMQRHAHSKKQKYNKEQFLQANFQFVIKASAKPKTDDSPDTLIDWYLIEQINIQTPEETQCPICLYPPIAAKITRCGHVYCWPCVLHYLSLSDKTWRKCPICYEAVHVEDLKSASIVLQQTYNIGSEIIFQLMRRKKGSLYIERYNNLMLESLREKYPYVSEQADKKLFSKFLLAKPSDVADILNREERELLSNVDETCPEYVFIQQAFELLKKRRQLLSKLIDEKGNDLEVAEKLQLQNVTNRNIELEDSVETEANDDKDEKLSEKNEENATNYNTADILTKDNALEYIAATAVASTIKYYYFYQCEDGQNIYLHPLNVKMLQACYGGLAGGPAVIKARILQKEHHSMDEDHRRKFTCLSHLPLTCQFVVVEIELLPPYITEEIMDSFKTDVLFRKKERYRRAREEREREKQINAINDRQMGKLIASTAKINLSSDQEFPTCGFEEPLVPATDIGAVAVIDNDMPTTSSNNESGRRIKTPSTSSSVGICSYSAIAFHCQQEHAPWATVNAVQLQKSCGVDTKQSSNEDDSSVFNNLQTNFGDVLAQAFSAQKQDKKKVNKVENAPTTNATNKKSKKVKKMLPLYSTGMNFSGN